MGRYRKYQPSNSTSAVGMSMGSPRLVARNMSFQMAREIPPRDPMSDLARESPSYANAPNPHMNFSSRPSPILGRRAMGPPPQASPKSHRRQPSELLKQEVHKCILNVNLLEYLPIFFGNFCHWHIFHEIFVDIIDLLHFRSPTHNNSLQCQTLRVTMLEAVTTIVQLCQITITIIFSNKYQQ